MVLYKLLIVNVWQKMLACVLKAKFLDSRAKLQLKITARNCLFRCKHGKSNSRLEFIVTSILKHNSVNC